MKPLRLLLPLLQRCLCRFVRSARKGIFVTGGSSHVPGLIEYMEQAFELPLTPLYDAENCVAIGGAKFLDDKVLLSDLLGIHIE